MHSGRAFLVLAVEAGLPKQEIMQLKALGFDTARTLAMGIPAARLENLIDRIGRGHCAVPPAGAQVGPAHRTADQRMTEYDPETGAATAAAAPAVGQFFVDYVTGPQAVSLRHLHAAAVLMVEAEMKAANADGGTRTRKVNRHTVTEMEQKVASRFPSMWDALDPELLPSKGTIEEVAMTCGLNDSFGPVLWPRIISRRDEHKMIRSGVRPVTTEAAVAPGGDGSLKVREGSSKLPDLPFPAGLIEFQDLMVTRKLTWLMCGLLHPDDHDKLSSAYVTAFRQEVPGGYRNVTMREIEYVDTEIQRRAAVQINTRGAVPRTALKAACEDPLVASMLLQKFANAPEIGQFGRGAARTPNAPTATAPGGKPLRGPGSDCTTCGVSVDDWTVHPGGKPCGARTPVKQRTPGASVAAKRQVVPNPKANPLSKRQKKAAAKAKVASAAGGAGVAPGAPRAGMPAWFDSASMSVKNAAGASVCFAWHERTCTRGEQCKFGHWCCVKLASGIACGEKHRHTAHAGQQKQAAALAAKAAAGGSPVQG